MVLFLGEKISEQKMREGNKIRNLEGSLELRLVDTERLKQLLKEQNHELLEKEFGKANYLVEYKDERFNRKLISTLWIKSLVGYTPLSPEEDSRLIDVSTETINGVEVKFKPKYESYLQGAGMYFQQAVLNPDSILQTYKIIDKSEQNAEGEKK